MKCQNEHNIINKTLTPLKVGIFVDPPWINENWENSTNKDRGILIDLLDIFCQMMNAKCELIKAPSPGYGDFTNGTWHGMVKYISENLFNLSFPGYTPTQQRFEVIDFSDRVYKVPLVLVTRAADPKSLSLWSFMAFHWSVWLLLLGASTFMGVFMAFIEINQWNPKKFVTRGFIRCLDSFAIMSNQGLEVEMVRISVRLLVTFWALATLVLGGVYSGHLLSFMIGTRPGLPFKDFDTFSICVEMRKCRLVAHSMSISFIQSIFTSPDPAFVRINKSIPYNPIKVVPNEHELVQLILDTKDVYLTWYTSHPQFMDVTHSNKKCLYSTVDSTFTDDMAFPLPKNSSIKENLNINVTYIMAMGIPDKIYNDYIGVEGECTPKKVDDSNNKPLPFTSIIGLLFILACGGVLGFGALICENVVCRCYCFRKKFIVVQKFTSNVSH